MTQNTYRPTPDNLNSISEQASTPSQFVNDLLPENQPFSTKAEKIPPEMVLHIAMGVEPPVDVAARHGYTPDEFALLEKWPPFQQQVAQTKAQLAESGYDFKMMNRLMAHELGRQLFLIGISNNTTFGQKHDLYRTMAEFGDLKPKPASQATTAGNGFEIHIHYPSDTRERNQRPVIDAAVTVSDEAKLAVDNPFVIDLHLPDRNAA